MLVCNEYIYKGSASLPACLLATYDMYYVATRYVRSTQSTSIKQRCVIVRGRDLRVPALPMQPNATEVITNIKGEIKACTLLNDKLECSILPRGKAFVFPQAPPPPPGCSPSSLVYLRLLPFIHLLHRCPCPRFRSSSRIQILMNYMAGRQYEFTYVQHCYRMLLLPHVLLAKIYMQRLHLSEYYVLLQVFLTPTWVIMRSMYTCISM